MKDQMKAEETATFRVQLLAPLLEEGLDGAKARQIRKRICEETGLSERSVRRYIAKYREEGFSGLRPKGKAKTGKEDPIPPDILVRLSSYAVKFPGAASRRLFRSSNGKPEYQRHRLSAVRCRKSWRSVVTAHGICVCIHSRA